MTKICFLNPFGTHDYDDLIEEVLTPSLGSEVELTIRHLEGMPRNIDYYVPKHLVEVGILKAALQAERDGFDAFVIGCCYDPGLLQARELCRIPIVGPLEAAVSLAHLFGHRFAVVTDHHKAVPYLENLVRLYGLESNCRGVSAVEWFVDDMIGDPDAVARDAYQRCQEALERDGAEVAVIGCTIVAACYERSVLAGAAELGQIAVVNPNLMAVKLAQMLAEMQAVGQYRISRAGLFQGHASHDAEEAGEVLAMLEGTTLGAAVQS